MSPLVPWLLLLGGTGLLIYTAVSDNPKEQKIFFYLMNLMFTTHGGWLLLRDRFGWTIVFPIFFLIATWVYLIGYYGYWKNRRLWKWMEDEWLEND